MAAARYSISSKNKRPLRAIRRVCDRRSKKYPDLRLDLFVAPKRSVPATERKGMWHAVEASFTEEGAANEEWLCRHPDKAFCYRFHGNKHGYSELLGLEQDIEQALDATSNALPADAGRIPPWALAYYMGLPGRIPLLRTEVTRTFVSKTAHRSHWPVLWLTAWYDPFLLMGAALDWILEPDASLAEPDSLRAIPDVLLCSAQVKEFVTHVAAGDRATRVADESQEKPAKDYPNQFVFDPEAECWLVRFADDGEKSRKFKDTVGARRYAHILSGPRAGVESLPLYKATQKGKTRDRTTREDIMALAEGLHGSDSKRYAEVCAELKQVEDRLEMVLTTGNVKQIDKLQQRKQELEAEKGDLSSAEDIQSQNSIDKSLWDFRQILKRKERGRNPMPHLSAHLEIAVRPKGTAWVYNPNFRQEWFVKY